MQTGQIIHRNGERLICTRTRQNGIFTFQVIDLEGKPIIEYYKNAPAIVKDHGIRLIKYDKLNAVQKTIFGRGNNKHLCRAIRCLCRSANHLPDDEYYCSP